MGTAIKIVNIGFIIQYAGMPVEFWVSYQQENIPIVIDRRQSATRSRFRVGLYGIWIWDWAHGRWDWEEVLWGIDLGMGSVGHRLGIGPVHAQNFLQKCMWIFVLSDDCMIHMIIWTLLEICKPYGPYGNVHLNMALPPGRLTTTAISNFCATPTSSPKYCICALHT